MKIGDLWVKLGLKKDEFSKGIKDADGEVKGFAGSMKSMAGAAKVAWAAVGAAVVKFATDAVKMTQRWGDAWNQTMAGIKGAYSTFVRQISSGDGWNNLFANMREAYRVSKELAAALDEVFERKISLSYTEANIEKQIAEQQLIMRDASKSEKEREAAAKKIISLTEDLGKEKRAVYSDEAKDLRDNFRIATGIQSDDDIDYLVKEYNQNRDIITQAREYASQLSSLQTAMAGSSTAFGGMWVSPMEKESQERYEKYSAALSKLESETPEAVKRVAELTKAYDRANDDLVKGMADADVAVIRVDTEMLHAQTRATALLGTLNKAGGSSGNTEADRAASILARAQDAAKSEIQILSEKYQEEKALLKKYGLDTEALWEEYSLRIDNIVSSHLDVGLSHFDLSNLEIELPEIEIDDDDFYADIAKFLDEMERAKEVAEEFGESVSSGFSDAFQTMIDQFAGLEEINPGQVVQALLTPLADMAIREGELLIAAGVGVEAIKESLTKLSGVTAILAGTALVALGAAAKSGLAALGRSGASSTTTSYSSADSSAAQTQTIETEMTVYVTGRLSGSDILLSGKKTQNNWDR